MIVRLLTVVPSEYVKKFIEDKQIKNLDLVPLLHPELKAAISEFLRLNSGYNVTIPMATISKLSDGDVSLASVGTRVDSILPIMVGSTVWQIEVKDDLVASISYSKLLEYNEMYRGAPEESFEMLGELLRDDMTLGSIEGDPELYKQGNGEDIISFIPFMGLDKCRHVIAVDDKWDEESMGLPDKIKFTKSTSFDNLL